MECLRDLGLAKRSQTHTIVTLPSSLLSTACEGLQEDITCGIVRMTITVTAPQDIAPSEDELRAQVIATLREAINGDGFEAYFPPGCSVTG
jgi:Malate dehydrogenase enzyme